MGDLGTGQEQAAVTGVPTVVAHPDHQQDGIPPGAGPSHEGGHKIETSLTMPKVGVVTAGVTK